MKITHDNNSNIYRERGIKKYGSYEAYREEMKRRRSLFVPKSKLSKDQLKEYLQAGKSQNEIAEKTGLSQAHISYLVNKKYRLFDETE